MVASPLGQRIWVSFSPFLLLDAFVGLSLVFGVHQVYKVAATQNFVLQKEVAPKANIKFGNNS